MTGPGMTALTVSPPHKRKGITSLVTEPAPASGKKLRPRDRWQAPGSLVYSGRPPAWRNLAYPYRPTGGCRFPCSRPPVGGVRGLGWLFRAEVGRTYPEDRRSRRCVEIVSRGSDSETARPRLQFGRLAPNCRK